MRPVQIGELHRSKLRQILPELCAAVALGGKSLSKMRLVQLKELHKSIFQQIPALRFAQVDIPTGFALKELHRSIFQQIPALRFAQVDIPYDFFAARLGSGATIETYCMRAG